MKRYIKSAIKPVSEESTETQRHIAESSRSSSRELDDIVDALLLNDYALNSNDADTLWYISANPNVSPQTLAKLARCKTPFIQISVAENPNTPEEALRSLATSTESKVLYALLTNPSTPDDIVSKLSHIPAAMALCNRKLEFDISFECFSEIQKLRTGTPEINKIRQDVVSAANRALSTIDVTVTDKNLYIDPISASLKARDGRYKHFLWASLSGFNANMPDRDICFVIRDIVTKELTDAGYIVQRVEFMAD